MKDQEFKFDAVETMQEQIDTLLGIIDTKELIIQNLEEQIALRDGYIESLEDSFDRLQKLVVREEPKGAVLL